MRAMAGSPRLRAGRHSPSRADRVHYHPAARAGMVGLDTDVAARAGRHPVPDGLPDHPDGEPQSLLRTLLKL